MNAISISSDLRLAQIEIDAWTKSPETSLDEMSEGLLDAYQNRTEPDRLSFVAALIGRLMILEARRRCALRIEK